jgi:SAM-dependent methyltransferase
MGLRQKALARRADRALERQLKYQREKAEQARGNEPYYIAKMLEKSSRVRAKLEAIRPIPDDARVLEVGSGAHGLIFYFGSTNGVGVDPLADHYARLFPAWQSRAKTVAAPGEALPFDDHSFDIVLCDNVVDHATDPARIVRELVRVLAPGGLLYFTVNVHHPFYHAAASLHAGWRAIGVPLEITPFADHTVHLTLEAAEGLFQGLPLRRISERNTIEEVKRNASAEPARHAGDRLKRLFFKNALFELIAVRLAS